MCIVLRMVREISLSACVSTPLLLLRPIYWRFVSLVVLHNLYSALDWQSLNGVGSRASAQEARACSLGTILPPRVLNFVTRTTVEQHNFSIVRGSFY